MVATRAQTAQQKAEADARTMDSVTSRGRQLIAQRATPAKSALSTTPGRHRSASRGVAIRLDQNRVRIYSPIATPSKPRDLPRRPRTQAANSSTSSPPSSPSPPTSSSTSQAPRVHVGMLPQEVKDELLAIWKASVDASKNIDWKEALRRIESATGLTCAKAQCQSYVQEKRRWQAKKEEAASQQGPAKRRGRPPKSTTPAAATTTSP